MRWRFVEDELPKPFEPLLLWVEWSPLGAPHDKREECVTGHMTADGYWITTILRPDRVIAWQPRPKAPKKMGKKK